MTELFFCKTIFFYSNVRFNFQCLRRFHQETMTCRGYKINLIPIKNLKFTKKNKKSSFPPLIFQKMSINDAPEDEVKDQDISGDGGVVKNILTEGTGSVIQNGFQVKLNYQGKLSDGRVFDSSLTRKKPFFFTIGEGKVINGWEIGVKSMKVGEKAKFYISSKYGYKKKGIPPIIPPNADLFFEIEILDAIEPTKSDFPINPMARKNEISKSIPNYQKTESSKNETPNDKFFFISPFSSQTGKEAPWWLNPNITFFLIFILVITLFSTVYSLGGINHSFDNPNSILDSEN